MFELTEILNWRRLNQHISSSGQPTEEQLSEIKNLGITHVINLGPHANKGALKDEAVSVTTLGMIYIYIPVDFENPTEKDFENFCDVMEKLEKQKIHVHCIYNARVTAFFYRYAQAGRGISKTDAYLLMDSIWRPGGVWAKFIGNDDANNLPNQYAGHDY